MLGEHEFRRLRQMQTFYTQVADILGTLADIVQPRTFEELKPGDLPRWLDGFDHPAATDVAVGTGKDGRRGRRLQLGNVAEDYSQSNDLATKVPDKLRQMQELYLVEAAEHQVLPLDNSILPRVLAPKPSYTAGRTEFT